MDIPCRVPNFDQGLALPIVGGLGIIAQGIGETDREFTFVALRPQAEINAEYCAFRSRA